MPIFDDGVKGAVASFYPYQISQSLRFNDNDNAYLIRTPSSASNRQTWTWSGWVKRGNLGSQQGLFSAGTGVNDTSIVRFDTADTITFHCFRGTFDWRLITTQKFRDQSSWYHIVVVADTTNANASDRVRLYVNGVRITDFSTETLPTLNFNAGFVNNTVSHTHGNYAGDSSMDLDAYESEVNFVDGQALTANDFGEFKNGVWIPKEYTGSYGTNGFHLDFSDPGFIGKDVKVGPNLVTNGSFTENVNDWSLVSNVAGGPSITWQSDGSALITNATNNSVYYTQAFPTEIGETYYLSSWVEGISIGGSTREARMYWATADDNTGGALLASVPQSAGDGWLTGSFVATTTTSYIVIGVDILGSSQYGARFDRISATKTSGTNDWEDNGLVVSDVVLDSPTNNWCNGNPLSATFSSLTFSEGNLELDWSANVAANNHSKSTFGISSGKWYWEVRQDTGGLGSLSHGVVDVKAKSGVTPVSGDGWFYYGYSSASKTHTSSEAYGATYTGGDIIGILLDMDTGDIEFFKNGVSQGIAYSNVAGTVTPCAFYDQSNTAQGCTYNFGQDSTFAGATTSGGNTDSNGIGDFKYPVPAGALALCSSNLPELVIGPNSATIAGDHFNSILYQATGVELPITGVGFSPDVLWNKGRNDAQSHKIFDKIRGATLSVWPDTTFVENVDAESVKSFDVDGFTLGTSLSVNNSTVPLTNYVTWCWKMDGTGTVNNDGTIQTTVSANEVAGQSVGTYTSDGSDANRTVGHGLLKPIELGIVRSRTEARHWLIWHKDMNDPDDAALFTTGIPASFRFGPNAPTSEVFGVYGGQGNRGTNDYMFLAFHSVDGYSDISSYVGNGSTDGVFVYCGFKPAFVVIKCIDSVDNWRVYDNLRDGFNPENDPLYPNLSSPENEVSNHLDFVANGFKTRSDNNNLNGNRYIYMAFAESPFKYSNAG